RLAVAFRLTERFGGEFSAGFLPAKLFTTKLSAIAKSRAVRFLSSRPIAGPSCTGLFAAERPACSWASRPCKRPLCAETAFRALRPVAHLFAFTVRFRVPESPRLEGAFPSLFTGPKFSLRSKPIRRAKGLSLRSLARPLERFARPPLSALRATKGSARWPIVRRTVEGFAPTPITTLRPFKRSPLQPAFTTLRAHKRASFTLRVRAFPFTPRKARLELSVSRREPLFFKSRLAFLAE